MKKFIPFIAIISFLSVLLLACQNKQQPVTTQPQTDTTGLAAFQAFRAMEAQAMLEVPQQTVYRKVAPKKVVMRSESTNEAKVEKNATPAKKKGWSKAAKYSVIGGVGGGVLGAVINKKNPVKGAVIGAVILGGGGYVLGRSQDKKDGRVGN